MLAAVLISRKPAVLKPEHCDLFDRAFFQFAQMKKYQPEAIEPTKAAYKAAWQQWRDLISAVYAGLGRPFAPPHIERWCNGWQVRAHFFAYFKYTGREDDAVIFSILLNRRRLSVHLDWHCYKADRSRIPLEQYNRWLQVFRPQDYAAFEIWHGSEDEYADYPTVSEQAGQGFALSGPDDFFCIGRHVERDGLAQTDCEAWITRQIRALQPLYEACFE